MRSKSAKIKHVHYASIAGVLIILAIGFYSLYKPAEDYADIEPAAGAAGLPHNLAQTAASANVMARKWQSDAVLTSVQLRSGNGFTPTFEFVSTNQHDGLDVVLQAGKLITLPPGPDFNPAALPVSPQFIDVQAAISAGAENASSATIIAATLHEDPSGVPVWSLQGNPPGSPPVELNALTGQPMSTQTPTPKTGTP